MQRQLLEAVLKAVRAAAQAVNLVIFAPNDAAIVTEARAQCARCRATVLAWPPAGILTFADQWRAQLRLLAYFGVHNILSIGQLSAGMDFMNFCGVRTVSVLLLHPHPLYRVKVVYPKLFPPYSHLSRLSRSFKDDLEAVTRHFLSTPH